MSIQISEARIAQIKEVITNWCDNFSKSLSEAEALEEIQRDFDPQVEWYDHGFYICRVGHNAVLGLRKSFLHCNQPFRSEIKSILPTADGAAVEQLWIGRCTNDIVRPDGSVVMRGSGKEFKSHVGFFVKISEAGKITRIDEYDHRYWDEGVHESSYKRMT
ncbi:hypothetical protein M409DRAFT_19969 [Zasmidium cellare ATCC 36951]|uniref:SnoaL-like domain-containing protein n=1 Tax=Zasmidium cellare ATCC 36951 TaxID=1080233 RepID=A0A6A6CQI2_ZASCE|nr:uncharacterized protein M409DRAFT_19969 [Zasmidium cellare ATCC 36951]KAF2169557.1 hypothetical protein M409DRAFT_19969 [Zasmidium cellare ATCC 36951]